MRNLRWGHGFSNRGDITSVVWQRIQGNYQHAHETNDDCRSETAPSRSYYCDFRDIYGSHHPRPYAQRTHWNNSAQYWLFYHLSRECWQAVRTDGPYWCIAT